MSAPKNTQIGADAMIAISRDLRPYIDSMDHIEQAQFWAGFMGAMFGACAASIGMSDTEVVVNANLDACRHVAKEKTQ